MVEKRRISPRRLGSMASNKHDFSLHKMEVFADADRYVDYDEEWPTVEDIKSFPL